jgi:hypothetical protein
LNQIVKLLKRYNNNTFVCTADGLRQQDNKETLIEMSEPETTMELDKHDSIIPDPFIGGQFRK